tara:strand:+ start:209 stop:649 length:441 start_codon:yes stop_codon:yes gene_type:complete
MTEIQEDIKKHLDPIKETLDHKFGVDIFQNKRTRQYTKAREFFMAYSIDNYSYSKRQLSIYMGKTHATGLYCLRSFKDSMKYDKDYKKHYNRLSKDLDAVRIHLHRTQKYSAKKRLLDRALYKADDKFVDYIYNILYKNPSLKINK